MVSCRVGTGDRMISKKGVIGSQRQMTTSAPEKRSDLPSGLKFFEGSNYKPLKD